MQDTQNLQLLKAELTEDQFIRAEAVLTSVRAGASLEDACEAADITRRTWYNWQDKHPILKQIVGQIRNSRVGTCKGILYECALQARTNPRFQPSLFFLLEREARDEYGNRLSYVDETKSEALIKAMKNDELAELTYAVARALTGESEEAVRNLIAGISTPAEAEADSRATEGAGESHP